MSKLQIELGLGNSPEDARSAQCDFVSWWLSGLVAGGCCERIEKLLTEKACTDEDRAEMQEQVRLSHKYA